MSGRPNGKAVLEGSDPKLLRALGEELLARAARARTDPAEFFELVMREELTRRPMRALPHQRAALDFILGHDRSVNMWPIGTSKSFLSVALTLYFLGQDPTTRGAVVSATEAQAKKVLNAVRSYLEGSVALRLVFPKLRRTGRGGEPWSDVALTVDRPPGIRDASVAAYGRDTKRVLGSRLNWVLVDDILNDENCNTKEARDDLYQWFDSDVLSRLDPPTVGPSRVVVTNTPRHADDLLHRLIGPRVGWPLMRMDILGNVFVQDDAEDVRVGKYWDSDQLRPATPNPANPALRLTGNDPDPHNAQPLWPRRYPLDWIEKKRRTTHPVIFQQTLMCVCRDDETSMCKLEWIERCKEKARARGVFTLSSRPTTETGLVFTGVDLAIGLGEEHDDTCLFTFEVLDDKHRRILDVDVGKYDGVTVRNKIIEKHRQYGSVVRVENNAAQQLIVDMVRDADVSVPIKSHTTTAKTKADLTYGLPALFTELYGGLWLIPNDRRGECPPAVQRWVDACLNYLPTRHPDDTLMAGHLAHAQAHDWGVLTGEKAGETNMGNFAMEIAAR